MGAEERSWGKPLLLVASLAVAAGLSEVALGIVKPDRFRVWEPGLTMTFQPKESALPGISGASRFAINAEGMRADAPDRAEAFRILTVGGSTTECLFLDQGEAWPALVQEGLTTPEKRVIVGSVGKSGHTARQHVLQLTHLLPQHPGIQAVVLLAGVNDVQQRLGSGVLSRGPFGPGDYAKAFMRFPDAFAARDDAPLHERTRLYRLFAGHEPPPTPMRALVQDAEGMFYVGLREQRRRAALETELPDLTEALAQYRRDLDAMADVALQRSVRLVLMTQPVLWRADLPADLDALLWFGWSTVQNRYYAAPALAEAMDRYNRVLLHVCYERGLECIDLASMLPKDTSVFYDDCHFNESGARKVAEVVTAHFKAAPGLGR